MAIQKITQVIRSCDLHEGCKDPEENLMTVDLFHPETGEPIQKETCPRGIAEMSKARETLVKGARPNEEKLTELEEEKKRDYERGYADGQLAKKKGGTPPLGGAVPWKPLADAAREWSREVFGTGINGNPGRNHPTVKQFLATPRGEPWRDWEPGKPIPGSEPVTPVTAVFSSPEQAA